MAIQSLQIILRRCKVREYRLLFRRKEHIATNTFQEFTIPFELAGVVAQVFWVAELQWVNENTAYHFVANLFSSAYQIQVTFMQGTHSGYEPNAGTFPTALSRPDRALGRKRDLFQ